MSKTQLYISSTIFFFIYSPLERVSVSEVTLSHLIAYDPDRDLLPLILAHCNYSLEVGRETLVHYDWAALERQLIDRMLWGRPFVEFKVGWKYLEHIIYDEKKAFSVFSVELVFTAQEYIYSLHSLTEFASSYCKQFQSHFFRNTFPFWRYVSTSHNNFSWWIKKLTFF